MLHVLKVVVPFSVAEHSVLHECVVQDLSSMAWVTHHFSYHSDFSGWNMLLVLHVNHSAVHVFVDLEVNFFNCTPRACCLAAARIQIH